MKCNGECCHQTGLPCRLVAARQLVGRFASLLNAAGTEPAAPAKSLPEAIAAFRAAKLAANRSPYYVRQTGLYLDQFARSLPGATVAGVQTDDVERWFRERSEVPSTRRNSLKTLRTFFAFARRQGWRLNDPTAPMESPTVELKAPAILTPAEARRLVTGAPERMRGYVVLCLFAGLRPSEAHHIEWADVDLAAGNVKVRFSKLRRWRMAHLPACAVAWLRPLRQEAGKVAPSLGMVAQWRKGIAPWFGRRLKQDELRHTAASYLLAREQDVGKVATWLGNSPAILLTHYRELVSKEAAAEFFGIFPPA